ncbi:MAG: mechanosensitive ion channel family protein [Candidatus Kapaibacteriota bacterium]
MKFFDSITTEKVVEILIVLVLFFVLLVIIKLLSKRIRFILRDKVSFQTLSVLNRFIIWIFIILYIFVILSYFGINLTGLLALGGFASIIIGFATQKVVGNSIAGLFLIFERPIKLGQSVRIADVSGFVEEIRFLSTIIRSFEGEFIRIPNEQVFTSIIINLTENVARRVDYIIGIHYSNDFSKAREIILNFLNYQKFVLSAPAPEVFVEKFSSSSVDIHIRFWAPTEKWYETKNNLLPIIRTELENNGINIPYPQMEIKIHNLKDFNKFSNEQDS